MGNESKGRRLSIKMCGRRGKVKERVAEYTREGRREQERGKREGRNRGREEVGEGLGVQKKVLGERDEGHEESEELWDDREGRGSEEGGWGRE